VRLIHRLANFWQNLRHPDRVERDLDEEMRSVLALLVDEKLRAGMGTEDARRAAALELGGVEVLKAKVRDVRAGAHADTFVRDARYGIRVLRRNPLFMLTAVLSLGSGIGATTTIFTVANGLLFRAPGGVSQADRLVDISRTQDGRFGINPISYPNYDDIRRRTTTLDGTYGYQLDLKPITMASPSGSESLFGNVVTTNYFSVLGVSPAAGRLFGPHDREELDANPIVVLSYRPPALRATEGTILRWSLPSSLGGPGRNRTRCRGDQPRRATNEDRAKPARAKREVVTLNFASWNRVVPWLRAVDELKRAA
jgi:hypothetical protein